MDDLGELLRVREAARLLGLHPATIRLWIHTGRLPGFRVGGRLAVRRADVQAAPVPVEPGGRVRARPANRRETKGSRDWARKILDEAGI